MKQKLCFVGFAIIVTMTFASVSYSAQAQDPQPGGEPIATATPAPKLPTMAAPGGALPAGALPTSIPTPVGTGVQIVVTKDKAVVVKDGKPTGDEYVSPFLDPRHDDPSPRAGVVITSTYVSPSPQGAGDGHPKDSAINPDHTIQLTQREGFGIRSLPTPMTFTAPTVDGSGRMVIDVFVSSYNRSNYMTHPDINTIAGVYTRSNELKAALEQGSRWLGTGNTSIVYNIVDVRRCYYCATPVLTTTGTPGNIGAMMTDPYGWSNLGGTTVCQYIATHLNPVQMWVYGDTRSHLPEFAVTGPKFHNGFNTKHNMAACGKQYVFFGFAHAGEAVEGNNNWYEIANDQAMHDHGHYHEWMLNNSAQMGYHQVGCRAVNPTGGSASEYFDPSSPVPTVVHDLYECAETGAFRALPGNTFMGRATTWNGAWAYNGCGDIHYPPTQSTAADSNPKNAYIYTNTVAVGTRCDNWWVQTGSYTNVSCTDWSCTRFGYYSWWDGRIPGWGATAPSPNISSYHYGWWALLWILQ